MKIYLLLIGTVLPSFAFFWVRPAMGQTGQVHGIVRDASGDPMVFASVSLKNTELAGLTDQTGEYRIARVPAGSYEISVRYLGYEPIEQKLEVVANSDQRMDFELKIQTGTLDEVKVRAQKQSALQEQKAIAINSLDIKEHLTQNNLLTDVIDRVSGVRIRRSSSLGDPSDISINGMRGTAVRVYIDGLPMEFLYPSLDISNLPLGNISRVDVYKGVIPVDVGSDAMGGAINIVTRKKAYSRIRGSYTVGSFNTHLADLDLGYASQSKAFVNLSFNYNYSDNDYGMRALVYEENKVKKVRRFHDAYGMLFGGLSAGVHSKPWTDDLRFTLNFSKGFKELQNGSRIATTAIGQARYAVQNAAANLSYAKELIKNRLDFSTLTGYSAQDLNYTDTSTNVYSWSGKVVGKANPGEYTSNSRTLGHYGNFINRSTLKFDPGSGHRLLFSNLYARQQLTGKDYLLKEGKRDYLAEPQYLDKWISGLQYEWEIGRRWVFSGAIKRFAFAINGVENMTFEPVSKRDAFYSWNAGLKYVLGDGLFFRTSYEKGFLIPQFYQFVGNGADIVRNSELKPESSDNVNLGFVSDGPLGGTWRLKTNINGFYRKQNDIIFLGSSITRRYENADQVRTYGIEANLTVQNTKSIGWKSNLTFLDKRFSDVSNPRNTFLIGTTFPNNPRFYANSELEWRKQGLLLPKDAYRAYVFYQYVAPFNHILIGDSDTPLTNPEAFVPAQHRLDIGTSYKFGQSRDITMALNVLNVLNAELFDNFRVPRSGISFNAKLIFEIYKQQKEQ
ncbi:TonB-dependent receptor [Marinilongibacter aquaticus]|uniref:TonB-dependent receptor n=1 Tax=Marinilongibacter aquaticus TaxID=2975157 RepID=UPI0021BD0921|nr:TonB-dependent receptor [Marinilongibacter aquaticus]UBM58734.1 TonB-dependent receptor [Marinilongibacter aquaticus]